MWVGPVMDQFSMHALHTWPGSPVPYLALAVCNEDMRRERRGSKPKDYPCSEKYIQVAEKKMKICCQSLEEKLTQRIGSGARKYRKKKTVKKKREPAPASPAVHKEYRRKISQQSTQEPRRPGSNIVIKLNREVRHLECSLYCN